MKCQIEKIEEVKVIRIREDRLDSDIAPELKTLFLVWAKPDDAKILVDLEKVTYVDSSGLGALLFGFRQARDHDGTVRLLKAQNRVKELISIAHLDNILINYDNEKKALESFA